jgi:hypothetical protein
MVKDPYFFSLGARTSIHSHPSLFKIPKTVFDSQFPSGNRRLDFTSSAQIRNKLIGVPRERLEVTLPRGIKPNFPLSLADAQHRLPTLPQLYTLDAPT